MASVLAFLGAVPSLIALFKEGMAFLNKISGNDPQGFIKKLGDAFALLNKAETPEEKTDAAKAIASSIAGL